jgi:hypothetical protein
MPALLPTNYSPARLKVVADTSPLGTRIATAQYDFAEDGGAISTIALSGRLIIPALAVITGGYVEVITQLTSGGAATIACQVEAANDVLTAVAVASWTVGVKNILPALTTGALTASTKIQTTVARDISIVIAAAALTAGKFNVVLYYTDATQPE